MPALDAASLEVAKFLPMQKQNGAKHFDVEQVVLAAAVAAKDVETLKAEIIGPNASHLSFASLRLCELGRKFPDLVTTAHLLELLVSLPLKRRKPFIKSLIKERHTAVLDAYVTQHLAKDKDGTEQIARILHGLSSAVVQEWLPTFVDNGWQTYLRWSHLTRYHSAVLLQHLTNKVESAKAELDKLAEDADKSARDIAQTKITRTWETFTTTLNSYGRHSIKLVKRFLSTPIAKGEKTMIAKQVLLLAKACPSYASHSTKYYPTLPTMVVQHFKFLSEEYEAELLDLCSICIRPEYGYHVYTFSIPASSMTRPLCLRFLELSLPRSVDLSVPESHQITPSWIYTAAIAKLSDMSYWPDAVIYAKQIKKWSESYVAVRPAALKRIGANWYQPIITALVNVKDRVILDITTRQTVHYNLALKKVKKNGPLTPEKQHEAVAAVLPFFGKLTNLSNVWEFETEIINIFKERLLADTAEMHGKDVAKPDHHLTSWFDSFHTFAASVLDVAHDSPTALQITLDYITANTVWKNSASERKFARFNANVFARTCHVLKRTPDAFSIAVGKTEEHKAYEKKFDTFCYNHVLATVKRFASTDASAGTLTDFETQSDHPLSVTNLRRDFPARCFPLVVPFSVIEPIFNLLFKTGTFIEMVKENKLPTVVAVVQHLPGAVRGPILAALMDAKVCTASQKLELTPFLTIANDSVVRKSLETGTSSSSPGERVAALVRLVRATNSFPLGSLDSEIFAEPLSEAMAKQRTLMLKEAETTLSFVIKRIKNTIFQDRVLFQHYAWMHEGGDAKLFSAVWLAPGLTPTYLALWLEMLDDHLQNPNQTQSNVEIEQPENYETALTPLGWTEQWGGYRPYAFWDYLAKRALSLGFVRQDAALIEFAVEIVCRIGTVASGASDPISDDSIVLNANFLMGHFLNLGNADKSNFALTTVINAVSKKYTDADLLALKKAKLFRRLATEAPVTFVERLPQVFEVIQKSIATLKEEVAATDLSLNAIAKPPLRTGFEEEEELEEFERKEIVTTLLATPTNVKRASQLPWLSDFVFNVGLKSWAAANYVSIAWQIRLQAAFDEYKKNWLAAHGSDKHHVHYPKPTGTTRRRIESAASHAFAREIIAICPSALHVKIFQRIIAHIDPTEFFSHIPTPQSAAAADSEDVEMMASAGLLGRFTPASLSTASIAARAGARPVRGARRAVRGRVARPVAAGAVSSSAQLSLYHASIAQLTAIKNITKVWRRGQSTKSSDNSNYFLPTLCYGMERWHPSQILAYGNALHEALLNPMRSQEIQKKLLILWTLLPTTNYADIVLFLQKNDFNFFPAADDPEEEGEDGAAAAAPAAEDASAPKPTLPLAVVEAAIHGTTMNDEPLAPLPFLLSPTFLSSSYSRVAIQAVQSLIKYAPEGLLTNALAYLLRDHRKKLKTSAHKQIIRFLASDVSLEHWEIFLSEWRNPRTHRDVRIVLLQAAFSAISVATGETLEKVWLLLALAADFSDPEVVCALLKTRPLMLPSRSSPYLLDLSETLFNNKVQSQYQSYTEICIPNDCAARYMSTVIVPILSRDDNKKAAAAKAAKAEKGESSMDVDELAAVPPVAADVDDTAMVVSPKEHGFVNGSDLQFLAYAALIKWAGFLNEAQPGKPDYTAVAVRLLDYVVDAVQHDENFVGDNHKKMLIGAARCVYFIGQSLWLLCLDNNIAAYADVMARPDYKEEDYNIAGGLEIVESLMERLVSFAESFTYHGSLGPVPTDMASWAEWIKENEILTARRNKEKEAEKEARKALSVARKVAKATSSPISPEAIKAVEDIEAMPKTVVEEEFVDPEYDEVTRRYRRFGNAVGAIVAMCVSLDRRVLAKGYVTADEQERIYAPLLRSRFASLPAFVNTWIQLDIEQIHHTKGGEILAEGAESPEWLEPSQAFLKAYERTIRRIAANTNTQTLAKTTLSSWVGTLLSASHDKALELGIEFIDALLAREKTQTWTQSMPSIGSGSYYLEQIDGFSTKAVDSGNKSRDNLRSRVERSVDIDISFALINQILCYSSHSVSKIGAVLPKVMSMVEHLFKVICFELPGLSHIASASGSLESLVGEMMSRLSWDTYHMTQSHRKELILWIVKSSLDILENHPSTGAANKSYRKMWHGMLHKTSGALFAKYAPEHVARLVYYLAQEDGAITTWVSSMIGEWLSPTSKIADPALGGVGTREHDLNAAVALVTDLVNVRLHTQNAKGEGEVLVEDSFEYVDRLFTAALSAVNGHSTLPRILYERNKDTYWKIFNTQIARAVFGGFASNDANAPTATTLKTHLESIYTKDAKAINWDDKYDQSALIKTIEQLFCASFASHGVATQVAKYYPFSEIQLQYAAMCRRLALDVTLALGTSSAVSPPKGAASGKSVWRPVFTTLLARIGASADYSVGLDMLSDLALAVHKF